MPLSRSATISLKLAVIAFLGLVLYIPTAVIGVLVEERSHRRDEVVREVSATWGAAQTVEGPVLSVPVRFPVADGKDGDGRKRWRTAWTHLLPEVMEVSGRLDPEVRSRGIYDVVLWRGTVRLSGRFALPDRDGWGVAGENALLDRAMVTVGVTDPKGLRERPVLDLGARSLELEPGVSGGPFGGLGARIDLGVPTGSDLPFSIELDVAGSESLFVLPLGRETRVELTSPWPDPSFTGSFLPMERTVAGDGFLARWQVLSLNRDAPQRWTSSDAGAESVAGTLRGASFGVRLVDPVDSYQRTMRSVKYAVLFALLTFLGFFAVEVACEGSIHPVQYVVIGFALCLFYVLLLSLSEILRFDLAYGLAAGAIITLVTAYARGILRRAKLAAWCGAVLAVVYSSLFVMLHLEELALLMGSLLLLVLCTVVMYLTRRLTWGVQSET